MIHHKGKIEPKVHITFSGVEGRRFGNIQVYLTPQYDWSSHIIPCTMLNKYHGDGDYIIHWDPKQFYKELSYEEDPIVILAKIVRNLRTYVILCAKVQWRNHTIEVATWETEADICKRYLHLNIDSGTSYSSCYVFRLVVLG